MKYLKYFEEASEYEAYKNGGDYALPNVSYVKENKSISYKRRSPSVKPSFNMVDLGLPSGTLWADKNIGATSPEDAGLYFAWGDTVGYTVEQVANGEKEFAYNWSDYFDTTDGGKNFIKYTGRNAYSSLQSEDDAASVNMGIEYRMPTKADCNELINNCTITFIDLDGNEFNRDELSFSNYIEDGNFKGVRFTGSNGNSIFFPISGHCAGGAIDGDHTHGYVLTSSLSSSGKTYAHNLYFDGNGSAYVDGYTYRYYGTPVRGIK
jgi:hypothetical protein